MLLKGQKKLARKVLENVRILLILQLVLLKLIQTMRVHFLLFLDI